jgi:hypothetical protein
MAAAMTSLRERANLARLSFRFLNLYRVGRTPLMGDQSVAWPLHTHTDIYASSGIRTHDPSVRASEDNALDRAATVIGKLSIYCV